MDRVLEDLLDQRGGVVGRTEATRVMPVHVFDRAVRRGELRAMFPRVYARTEDLLDPRVRRRAGLHSAGEGAALSHSSALEQWGLGDMATSRKESSIDVPEVHVTVEVGRQPAARDGLRVHRRRGFRAVPPQVVVRDGMPTVRLERALVEGWPLLRVLDRRAPVITAVRSWRTTPERVRAEVQRLPHLVDRARLLALLSLLEAGCQSELEIWGYGHVFASPALPRLTRQLRLAVGDVVAYVDVAIEEVKLAIELDGHRHHSTVADVEWDRRRDVALATLGWQTLRFSGRRLLEDPAGVVAEILAVVAARRSRLQRTG